MSSEPSLVSMIGVLVAIVDTGDAATDAVGILEEFCAFEVVVVSTLVFETVDDHGKLVITLPGDSEKTSETPVQSHIPRYAHPVPHPPMPQQQ